ncbi:MAG: DsrE/DsrF/DrsH-like family protein [Dehalococcoidia bacterium]|nr:DsrE/DsrF/DrsH-like family protein [Dehalococcoidia bacterium]
MIVGQDKESIAIVLHSGSYDRASYALSLAIASLGSGIEVHILLTYGGLLRFTKGHLEELGEETLEQFRRPIDRALGSGGIRPLEDQIADAKRLGLKLYACANAMANLNIVRDDLVPEVDETMGLITFLKFARSASINWYI